MDWETLQPFFERVYEHSDDGIWFAGPDLRSVHYVNQGLAQLVGVSTASIYEDPDAYLRNVQADDKTAYRAFRDRIRRTDTVEECPVDRRHEFRIHSGANTVRSLSEQVFPIADSGGAVQCWVGIVRDVSDYRERIDVLSVQAEQLEVLNQVVRHDIRNEVNLGMELLRTVDPPDETDQERLEQIAEILDRVAELTETARDMTGVITTLSEDPEPVSLSRTLNREIASVSTLSDAATIRTEREIPDVHVQANEILSAVFRNVLTNAIQHNDADEAVVTVSVSLTADTAIVHIGDNGPGIPDRFKETIFESGKTLAGSDGTGFGLSLAETLIDQYDGSIYVWDNDPRGTVFSISLPRARAPSETR